MGFYYSGLAVDGFAGAGNRVSGENAEGMGEGENKVRGYRKPLRGGGSTIIPRAANGRFRKASLRKDFGLDLIVCPHCGRFNPYSIGLDPETGMQKKRPTHCHACGKSLAK